MKKAGVHASIPDNYICHFCDRDIPVSLWSDDTALFEDLLAPPEWACYAAGCLDFDDLGYFESVCPACAERLAGLDWLEKGRAAYAQNDAFEAEVKARGGTLLPRNWDPQ